MAGPVMNGQGNHLLWHDFEDRRRQLAKLFARHLRSKGPQSDSFFLFLWHRFVHAWKGLPKQAQVMLPLKKPNADVPPSWGYGVDHPLALKKADCWRGLRIQDSWFELGAGNSRDGARFPHTNRFLGNISGRDGPLPNSNLGAARGIQSHYKIRSFWKVSSRFT